jgi:hypothetical protein
MPDKRPDFNFERRVVMASAYLTLDKAVSKHSPAVELIRTAVDNVAQHYGEQHRTLHARNEAGTPGFYYLHMTKAAGETDSLCALTRLHERVEGGLAGCENDGDRASWLGPGPLPQSCDQIAKRMEATNSTAHFVERYLDGSGTLCDDFIYGVMLRSPTARAISHANEMLTDTFVFDCPTGGAGQHAAGTIGCPPLNRTHFFTNVLSEPGATCNGQRVAESLFAAGTLPAWSGASAARWRAATGLTDVKDQRWLAMWSQLCGVGSNYQTRMLLGESLDHVPHAPAALPATDEEQSALIAPALKTLLQMSLINTYEDDVGGNDPDPHLNGNFTFETEEVSTPPNAVESQLLASGMLGWTAETSVPIQPPTDAYHRNGLLASADKLPEDDPELKRLEAYNEADTVLYMQARVIRMLDVRFLNDIAGVAAAAPEGARGRQARAHVKAAAAAARAMQP